MALSSPGAGCLSCPGHRPVVPCTPPRLHCWLHSTAPAAPKPQRRPQPCLVLRALGAGTRRWEEGGLGHHRSTAERGQCGHRVRAAHSAVCAVCLKLHLLCFRVPELPSLPQVASRSLEGRAAWGPGCRRGGDQVPSRQVLPALSTWLRGHQPGPVSRAGPDVPRAEVPSAAPQAPVPFCSRVQDQSRAPEPTVLPRSVTGGAGESSLCLLGVAVRTPRAPSLPASWAIRIPASGAVSFPSCVFRLSCT